MTSKVITLHTSDEALVVVTTSSNELIIKLVRV